MAYQSFLYSVEDGIATIRLNRPDTLNSLTFQVYRELVQATHDVREDERVRVLVITGEGRGFCSGGDVKEIIDQLQGRGAQELLAFTRMTGELTKGLLTLGKPSIAAVNGVAAGAGAVIACACDLRLGSERARFGFLFVKVGLTGADMGIAYLLPRLVGLGKASELLLSGDLIDAAEAERIGLLNKVVPSERLEAATKELAQKLAKGPPFALRITKELLHKEYGMDLNAAIELEAEAQALCLATQDHREGYTAFLEKREPIFRGL